MLINATSMRPGMVIVHNGDLHRIQNVIHITPGNWRGMVQTKMRNLRSGNGTEHRFRSEDRVDRAQLEQRMMEFLYGDGEKWHFMDAENFEQIALSQEDLAGSEAYLLPNTQIEIEFHEGRPIGVELPKTVDLTITETAPGIKGATASAQLKPATTETGLIVQVPSFIEPGETIRVDTATGEYVSRAKS